MALINLRNALMAGKKSPLPPGARWVEYLGFTSRNYKDVREYIDTGVVPDETFEFEIDVLWDIGYNTLYGREPISSRRVNSADTDTRFMLSSYFTKGYSYCGVGPRWDYSTTQPSGVRLHYEFHNKTLATSFAGNHVFTMPENMVPMRPVWLGAANASAEGICNPFGGNIYTCKLWLNNTLVRDFHPIAIGNTGYMLDLVSGEHLPYGNQGTGAFVIGPDVSASNRGGYKRQCVRRSYRRSSRPSYPPLAGGRNPWGRDQAERSEGRARFWRTPLWKEVA